MFTKIFALILLSCILLTDCYPKINGKKTGINSHQQYQCDFLIKPGENDRKNVDWFVDGVKINKTEINSLDDRIGLGFYNETVSHVTSSLYFTKPYNIRNGVVIPVNSSKPEVDCRPEVDCSLQIECSMSGFSYVFTIKPLPRSKQTLQNRELTNTEPAVVKISDSDIEAIQIFAGHRNLRVSSTTSLNLLIEWNCNKQLGVTYHIVVYDMQNLNEPLLNISVSQNCSLTLGLFPQQMFKVHLRGLDGQINEIFEDSANYLRRYAQHPYFQPLQTKMITKNELTFCWEKFYPEDLLNYKLYVYKHHDPETPVIETSVDSVNEVCYSNCDKQCEVCYTAYGLQANTLYRAFVRVVDPLNSTLFVLTTIQRTRPPGAEIIHHISTPHQIGVVLGDLPGSEKFEVAYRMDGRGGFTYVTIPDDVTVPEEGSRNQLRFNHVARFSGLRSNTKYEFKARVVKLLKSNKSLSIEESDFGPSITAQTEKVSIFATSFLNVDFEKNERRIYPRHFKKELKNHYSSYARVHKIKMLQQLEKSKKGRVVCYYELLLNDTLFGMPNLDEFENSTKTTGGLILNTEFNQANYLTNANHSPINFLYRHQKNYDVNERHRSTAQLFPIAGITRYHKSGKDHQVLGKRIYKLDVDAKYQVVPRGQGCKNVVNFSTFYMFLNKIDMVFYNDRFQFVNKSKDYSMIDEVQFQKGEIYLIKQNFQYKYGDEKVTRYGRTYNTVDVPYYSQYGSNLIMAYMSSFGNLPFNYVVRKLNKNYVIVFKREVKRVLSYSFTYNNQTIVLEGNQLDSSDYYRVAFKANSDIQNIHVEIKVQNVDPGKVFTYKKEINIDNPKSPTFAEEEARAK